MTFWTLRTLFITSALTSISVLAGEAPIINSTAPSSLELGQRYSYTVGAKDPEGESLSYELSYAPSGMTISSAGKVSWTPNANQAGQQPFKIKVQDDEGLQAYQYVPLSVDDPLNNAPQITQEPVIKSIALGDEYRYELQAMDTDGDALTYGLSTWPPAEGLSLSDQGVLTWSPTEREFVGNYWIHVWVDDGRLGTDRRHYQFSVTDPNNQPPLINNTPQTEILVGEIYRFELQASDADGDDLTYEIGTWPMTLGAELSADGVVTWTPTQEHLGTNWFSVTVRDDYLGRAKLSYTITVTEGGNRAPIIHSLPVTQATIGLEYHYTVDVSDPDQDPVGLYLRHPQPGMVLDGNTVRWTPTEAYPDGMMIKIDARDPHGGSTAQQFLVNVSNASGNANQPPIAESQSVTVAEDSSILINLSANDPEGLSLGYTIISEPLFGNISTSGSQITYTPNAEFSGLDSLTFFATDGVNSSNLATVSIAVTPVNDAPAADSLTLSGPEDTPVGIVLSANDIEGNALNYSIIQAPNHGTLNGAAPNITYRPHANFNGADSFTYRVNDGELDSELATVTLNIAAINDAPTTQDISVQTSEEASIAITLIGNDIDNDVLSFEVVDAPQNGGLSIVDAVATYTPNNSFDGTDYFTYRALDGELSSSPASVTIAVDPAINLAPSISSQPVLTVNEGEAYTYSVIANDPNGDAIHFSLDQAPEGMQIDVNGLISWLPEENRFECLNAPNCIAFQDNFSDITANAWYYLNGQSADGLINNGELQMPGYRKVILDTTAMDGGSAGNAGAVTTYTFGADFNFIDGPRNDSGFIFNYQDNQNYYMALFNAGSLRVFRIIDGVQVQYDGVSAVITGDRWYHFIAEVNDHQLEIFLDGESIFEDSNLLIQGGSIGFMSSTSTHFDNVEIRIPPSQTRGDVGDHEITVRVADKEGLADSQSYILTVLDINQAPTIVSSPETQAEPGVLYEYNVVTEDDSPDLVRVELLNGPAGMSVSNSLIGGVVQWVPSPADIIQLVPGASATEPDCVGWCDVFLADFNHDTITRDIDAFHSSVTDWDWIDENSQGLSVLQGSQSLILRNQDWSEYRLEARLLLPNGATNDFNVLFHYQNENNYYAVAFRKQSFRIFEVIDGQQTVLTESGGLNIEASTPFTVRVEANNDAVDIYLNDQAIYSHNSLKLSHGTVGLDGGGVLLAVDSLHVQRHQLGLGDLPQLDQNPVDVSIAAVDGDGLRGEQSFAMTVVDRNSAPIFTSIPPQYLATGAAMEYIATIEDHNIGDVITVSLSGGPAGADFDPQTNTLRWTSSAGGRFDFELTATDLNGASTTQVFSINVIAPGQPPVFINDAPTTVVEGELYSYRVLARDNDGGPIQYSLNEAPQGMSISAHSGLLRWIGTLAEGANPPEFYDVDIVATDIAGETQSLAVTVQVLAIPRIVTELPDTLFIGDSLNQTIVVEDANQDETHRFALQQAPSGMSIDETGLLSWLPSIEQVGEHAFTVTVTDSYGLSRTQHYTISVFAPGTKPAIVTEPAPGVPEGFAYQYDVDAIDPNPLEQLTYSLQTTPEGMNIDAGSGLINWQTQSPARFVEISFDEFSEGQAIYDEYPGVRFTARDADGNPRSLFINYSNNGNYVAASGGLLRPGEALFDDLSYDFNIHFDAPIDYFYLRVLDAEEPLVVRAYRHNVMVQELRPAGGGNEGYDLYFGQVGGEQLFDRIELDVSPGGPEFYDNLRYNIAAAEDVVVRATNRLGNFDQQAFTLRVDQTNFAPFITSRAPNATQVDQAFHYQVIAQDPDGDELSFSLNGAPASLSIDENGLISGQATAADLGEYTLEISVSDGQSASQQMVPFQVSDRNLPPVFTSSPGRVAFSDQVYGYDIDVYDPEGSEVILAATGLPGSMALDQLTGRLVWLPQADELGPYAITLIAIDEDGQQSTQSFTLSVNTEIQSPYFVSQAPLQTYVGSLYLYDADAITPIGGATLSYSLVQAPVGMSINASNGLIQWTADSAGDHNITVEANDGTSSVQQRFTLVVNEGNAIPEILSTPATVTFSDTLYEYQLIARDANDGDTLSFSIDSGFPAGMSFSASGLLQWTPSQSEVGSYPLALRVSDSQGGEAQQFFSLEVRGDNIPPSLILQAEPANPIVGETVLVTVQAGDNLAVTALNLSVDTAPVTLDANNQFRYLTTVPGDIQLSATASDLAGNNSRSDLPVPVADDIEPPQVSLSIDPEFPALNDTVTITVNLQDNGVATASLTRNGNSETLSDNQTTLLADALGTWDLEVVATDGGGNTVTSTSTVTISDPNDLSVPTAAIESPTVDSLITAPTDLIGSVGGDNLASYQVLLSPKGKQAWTTLSSGTSAISSAPLATLDPTLWVNGQYDVVLIATGTNGRQVQDSTSIIVEGELKVGNFSFTVEDMNVPLAGLPIRVTRTYDSRRKDEALDFGYGWSVGYQDVKVEESRDPGLNWEVNVRQDVLYTYHCVEPQGAPVVTITLPTGEVERFEAGASPECNAFTPILDVELEFNSVGDTQSTLIVTDENRYGRFVAGHLLDSGTYSAPLNPQSYQLTTRTGFVYQLNQDFGIETITDPNGHTLTYSDDGIIHSSGKSVDFIRDDEGRITQVVDPSGNAIVYDYDTNGDLIAVTERDGATTTHSYYGSQCASASATADCHLLDDMHDPLNRRMIKNIYDDDGRLIAQEDNEGNRTDFNHGVQGCTSAAGAGSAGAADIACGQSVVTDRDGRSTLFNYDDHGNVTEEIKLINDGSYDSDIVTTYTYDANDNQETKTIGGSTWTTLHNATNDITESRDPEGHSVFYEDYNSRGQEGRIVDERGNAHVMHYDAVGNLISIEAPTVTDPDTGEVTTPIAGNVINARGLVESTTDMRGMTTT